ncbi:unnamed protein product [Urochloa humidicola]
MQAMASGGARPEEAAESPSASASAVAASCMGTRPEELTARLAASVSAPGAGCGVSGIGADREAAEHKRWAKKLLYLRLGTVPAVVAALAEPGASPAALVQAAAAAGSFVLDAPRPWPAARAPGVRTGPRDGRRRRPAGGGGAVLAVSGRVASGGSWSGGGVCFFFFPIDRV